MAKYRYVGALSTNFLLRDGTEVILRPGQEHDLPDDHPDVIARVCNKHLIELPEETARLKPTSKPVTGPEQATKD